MLGFLAALGVVTLLLTAFGSSTPPAVVAVPKQAAQVLPSGQPEPQVIATVSNLRIQLPVAANTVSEIGFHGSRNGSLALQPLGSQANEGLLARLWHRIAGVERNGPIWYQLGGQKGLGTQVMNVGTAPGTDVYAPVDGTVAAISNYVRNNRIFGARIDIRPTAAPSVVVSLTHLRPDPALAVGTPVLATASKLGTVVNIASVERQALASHTNDDGNNVALEVHPAPSALP